jgi:hypothetical protein
MKTWLQTKLLLSAIAIGTSTAALVAGIGLFPTNFATINNSNEEEPAGSPPPGSGIQRDFHQPS